MSKLIVRLVLAVLILISPGLAFADDAAFERDVRRLMVVTGAEAMSEQVVNQMLEMMLVNLSGDAAEYVRRFRAELDVSEILEMNVPIYMKHFTHDEIKQLIEFYESPIGKKTVAKLPLVMQESMAAGQKWGEELGQRIFNELQNLE